MNDESLDRYHSIGCIIAGRYSPLFIVTNISARMNEWHIFNVGLETGDVV